VRHARKAEMQNDGDFVDVILLQQHTMYYYMSDQLLRVPPALSGLQLHVLVICNAIKTVTYDAQCPH
jgi:hypothetical protein